jgi:hypothetical protein
MSFFRNTTAQSLTAASSTVVHRAGADVAGVREAIDELTGLTVTAFPMSMVREIKPSYAMMTACYMLAGSGLVDIGESSRIGRRLYDHSVDSAKAWAQEAFVISRPDLLDPMAALYLQAYLTRAAEEAALVKVQKGTGAQAIDPSRRYAGPYCQMAEIAMRLLFDAGCSAFHVNACIPQSLQSPETGGLAPVAADTEDDDGPIEIGVSAIPADATEHRLAYAGLWARGYEAAGGGFVVTAGSEVRREINDSANKILRTRRAELLEAGVLADIPGLGDRLRLTDAVWFPSSAIAAKTVTGAHVGSSKWVPVDPRPPFVLAS